MTAERFIAEHIVSVAQLETILLLRARADDELGAEAVARELRIEPAWAAAELRALEAAGFVAGRTASPPVYRYAPRTAELARGVDLVADAYAQRRVAVTTAIFQKPSAPARALADAFRLRKDRS